MFVVPSLSSLFLCWILTWNTWNGSEAFVSPLGASRGLAMQLSAKPVWKTYWDLQCPFCRKNWKHMPDIKKRLEDRFDFQVHLTSLVFHPQAFVGQCAAYIIEQELGPQDKMEFINACYEHQQKYMRDAVGDARPSQVHAIFADIAASAGIFTETFTREYFLQQINNYDQVIKPTWQEHKKALLDGVFAVPKHVVDGTILEAAQSDWTPDDFERELFGTVSGGIPAAAVAPTPVSAPVSPSTDGGRKSISALGKNMMPSWTISGATQPAPASQSKASSASGALPSLARNMVPSWTISPPLKK